MTFKRLSPEQAFKFLSFALLCAISVQTFGAQEQWQTLSLAGNKMGYRHTEHKEIEKTLISRETLTITVSQPGASNTTTTTVLESRETYDGKPLSMSKTVSSATANHNMHATVDGDVLHLTQDGLANGGKDYPIPQPFLLSQALRQALQNGAGQKSPFNYFSWNFSNQQFEQIQLTVKPHRNPENPDFTWHIQRKIMSGGARETDIYTDSAFYTLREISRSGGDELRIESCTKECATAYFEPVTHVYRQLISSPYKISDAALRSKIRYQLLGHLSSTPPATSEQSVRAIDGGVEITVCSNCGSEPTASPADLTARLQANYWLTSDAELIHSKALEILGDKPISTAAKMRRLSRFVSRHMNEEASYSGYATALEAYHSKQGDCTEHALLLASLARAAGIPSRVAFGLAYSNERFLGRKYVFVPHAWVQAWTGDKWESFDSGLGQFTAGHIALGISNGEQSEVLKLNAQLHQLKITSAVQIKSR